VTLIQAVSYASAGLLAASKLIDAIQPLWAKLPKWLAVVAPVLVLDLPQVAEAIGGASTTQSLVTACLTSVALLLPGIAQAEAQK
jgi:hypothetical protein